MNSTTKLLVFTNYANSWSQNSWDFKNNVFLSLPLDPVSMENTVINFINDFFGSNVKSLNFPVKNSYLTYLKQSHFWCFWLLTLCAAPTFLVFNRENKSYIINLLLFSGILQLMLFYLLGLMFLALELILKIHQKLLEMHNINISSN